MMGGQGLGRCPQSCEDCEDIGCGFDAIAPPGALPRKTDHLDPPPGCTGKVVVVAELSAGSDFSSGDLAIGDCPVAGHVYLAGADPGAGVATADGVVVGGG